MEVCSYYFLKYFLCSCLSLFPLSSLHLEFPLCTCCPFWYCSTGLWGTNHFCFSVFHCFSECVVFIAQFSSSWILLPVQSIYCTSLLYLIFSYCIVHLTQFQFFSFFNLFTSTLWWFIVVTFSFNSLNIIFFHLNRLITVAVL